MTGAMHNEMCPFGFVKRCFQLVILAKGQPNTEYRYYEKTTPGYHNYSYTQKPRIKHKHKTEYQRKEIETTQLRTHTKIEGNKKSQRKKKKKSLRMLISSRNLRKFIIQNYRKWNFQQIKHDTFLSICQNNGAILCLHSKNDFISSTIR